MTGTNWPLASSQCGIRRPAPMPSTSVCSGNGIGVAQTRPNVPKFVTVAIEPPVASGGNLRCARQLNEFVVRRHQFFQRLFISGANHRHKHAVLGFNSNAHVNRRWMDNFVADKPAGWRAVFRKRDGQRAQRVKRRAGLWIRRFAMREQASNRAGSPTVASGRVQLRRMASATATRIGEAWLIFCFSRCAMNFSKSSTVTRPAAPLPATPARSAALKPNSVMRALSRGER